MLTKKLIHKMIMSGTVALTLGIPLSSSVTASASTAVENTGEQTEEVVSENEVALEKLSESHLYLHNDNSFEVTKASDSNGAEVEFTTGEVVELPSTAQDSNGDNVQLSYLEDKHGLNVYVSLSDQETTQPSQPTITTASTNWLQCGLGTVGSAITGGLGGAGKTIYLGPYALAGGLVGAIGGGSVGAAASCF